MLEKNSKKSKRSDVKVLNEKICFAINSEKKEFIRNKSKKMNISMSEYIRYCLDKKSDLRIDIIEKRFDKLEQMIFNLGKQSITQPNYETLRPPENPRKIITKKETTIQINFKAVVSELKEVFECGINNVLKPIEIEV